MNNKKLNSLGKILVKYRKILNFTQKDISKKLCLKLDLIRDIEKDVFPVNIPWVFYCGYIYSYARLVKVSKKKIVFFLEKHEDKNYYISNQLIKRKVNQNILFNNVFFLLIKYLLLFFSFYLFLKFLKFFLYKIFNNYF